MALTKHEIQRKLLLKQNFSSATSGDSATSKPVWGTPVDGTIESSSSVELLPQNGDRDAFIICNLDLQNWIYLNLNAKASAESAIYIVQPGQTFLFEGAEASESINAIASAGSINVTCRVAPDEQISFSSEV